MAYFLLRVRPYLVFEELPQKTDRKMVVVSEEDIPLEYQEVLVGEPGHRYYSAVDCYRFLEELAPGKVSILMGREEGDQTVNWHQDGKVECFQTRWSWAPNFNCYGGREWYRSGNDLVSWYNNPDEFLKSFLVSSDTAKKLFPKIQRYEWGKLLD